MSDDPIDVLIVGAGASGAAVAWSLAETKMRIVCLEQGGVPNPADYPANGRDWEARKTGDFHLSPNVRKAGADYPINDDESPIKVVNYNGVGGGTVLYAGHFPRFHPSDFRVRSLDGVADDWPLDYPTLAPFYAENDRMMGVSGLAGDPAYPPGNGPVMKPIPLGRSGETVARGFNKLGWHWWPSDVAIATEDYDGRAQCINLGACMWGCAQGAKASTDITYWPHAQRAGVELRTGCRVREITVGEDGMANGVIYFDEAGAEHALTAHVVVLACNGVGTARLLLNSVSAAFPDGLANRSGQVGRNLMFHPYAYIQGVFDEELDGYRGPLKSIRSQQFYETDPDRGFVRGYTFEATRGMSPVGVALNGLDWGAIPWGDGHHEAYRRLFKPGLGLCRGLRGSAGAAQSGDARSRTDRCQRDRRPQDQLYTQRQQHPDAGARLPDRAHGARDRGRRRGLHLLSDRLWRLASAGHRQDGHRPRALGGQFLGTGARCEEPLHRRRIDLRHLGRRQSNQHHSSPCAVHRRPDEAAPGQPVRLRVRMSHDTTSPFSVAERSALAALARLIVPPSAAHGLPGADDPEILASVLADAARHHAALTAPLAAFAELAEDGAAFRKAHPEAAGLIQTVVVQGYYRDDRVMRALAIELRPPFPDGYQVDQGDWSLLDPVRARAPLYRPTE